MHTPKKKKKLWPQGVQVAAWKQRYSLCYFPNPNFRQIQENIFNKNPYFTSNFFFEWFGHKTIEPIYFQKSCMTNQLSKEMLVSISKGLKHLNNVLPSYFSSNRPTGLIRSSSCDVRVFVFLFDVPFHVVYFEAYFAPTAQSWMSKIFRDSESLGKSAGQKWSQNWTFLLGCGLKLPRKKKIPHTGDKASLDRCG